MQDIKNKFFVVGVPIGNLKDITFRAVETLKAVDVIACEDTRTSSVLLNEYRIKSKLLDCHKFNEKERSKRIISLIKEGKSVALISDAGMPLICDPGGCLLDELLKENIIPTAIPSATALTTFLSLVPRENEFFQFCGFLPKTKNKRIEIFKKYNNENLVFYDSPNRIIKTMNEIKEIFGNNRKIAIGRELTKLFEEVKIGTVEEIIAYYTTNTLKGEIVGMIFAENKEKADISKIKEQITKLKELGYSPSECTKILTKLFNYKKNDIYDTAISLK